MQCFVPGQTSTSVLPSQRRCYSDKPSANWGNSFKPHPIIVWIVVSAEKSRNAEKCWTQVCALENILQRTLLSSALQHCHRCFECSMPLIFCSILCCAQKEAKSLPQNIKGCENQNVFSLEDAKSLANSQSDLRNMEMVTLDLESRKLWIQNILNLSTFQISHPTVSDIPIACVTSVSPLLKGNFLEPVHNKNDHKTRR